MTDIHGYSIAVARDMIPEKMKPYSSSLPPIYETYKGRYLAIGGQGRGVDWLTGDWSERMIMVGEFPTFDAVGAFWWSDEYRAAAKLRIGAVNVDVAQVPGNGIAPNVNHAVFLLIFIEADRPIDVPGGDTLVSVTPDQVTILEGQFGGTAITVAGFANRAALDAAWAEVKPYVDQHGGRACAANRAPG